MVTPALVRRRSEERGAALFVVVLVLTLLTAVGLFAAQSATLVDQASGYSRQAAQTSYLAEYGTLLATSELGSGAAAAYRSRMLSATDTCRANHGIVESGVGKPPCLVFFMKDFNALNGSATIDSAVLPNLTPDFAIEVTDPGTTGAPIEGTDLSGTGTAFGYMKVTVTSISQMRPGTSSSATCDEKVAPVTAQQMMRAHLIVGPVDL